MTEEKEPSQDAMVLSDIGINKLNRPDSGLILGRCHDRGVGGSSALVHRIQAGNTDTYRRVEISRMVVRFMPNCLQAHRRSADPQPLLAIQVIGHSIS